MAYPASPSVSREFVLLLELRLRAREDLPLRSGSLAPVGLALLARVLLPLLLGLS